MKMRMNNHWGVFSIGMPSLKSTSLAAPLPTHEGRALLPAPLSSPRNKRGSYSLCCRRLNRSVILVADRPPALVAVTLA